jgi:hypothetical protein
VRADEEALHDRVLDALVQRHVADQLHVLKLSTHSDSSIDRRVREKKTPKGRTIMMKNRSTCCRLTWNSRSLSALSNVFVSSSSTKNCRDNHFLKKPERVAYLATVRRRWRVARRPPSPCAPSPATHNTVCRTRKTTRQSQNASRDRHCEWRQRETGKTGKRGTVEKARSRTS